MNTEPPNYFAQPPLARKWSDIRSSNFLCSLLKNFILILVQPVIPYNKKPEEITPPPESTTTLSRDVVDQCKRIYDETQSSRTYLEDKARGTFSLIAVLAPLLASLFFYLFKEVPIKSDARVIIATLASLAGVLLVLAFISAARAVSVKSIETLFLGSVIDEERKDFREYDAEFYARGLLYCASMNSAMNAHIGQFVKGAQVLVSLAVLLVFTSAVPLFMALASNEAKPIVTEITGNVTVTSPKLTDISEQVTFIRNDLGAGSINTQDKEDIISNILEIVDQLNALEQALISRDIDQIPVE